MRRDAPEPDAGPQPIQKQQKVQQQWHGRLARDHGRDGHATSCTTAYGPHVTLLAIVLFGAALRLYGLPSESPWWDEIVTLDALDAPGLLPFLSEVRAADPPMTPVYFTLAWYWSRLGGDSVLWMRLLSVTLGLATIPVLYVLGRRLFGAKAAAIGALALSASLVHVYYSQEVRVYALATLLAASSMYAFIRGADGGRRSHAWVAANVAFNGMLAFTHLFGVMLFVPQALFLLVRRRNSLMMLAGWGAAHAAIAIALVFWLSTIDTATIHEAADWMVRPGWREVAIQAVVFAGGRPSNENPAGHLPGGVSLDLALAGLAVALVAWRVARTRPHGETVAVLLMWLILPPLMLFAASYVWRPCFVYRYILFASLPWYVLLGAAVSHTRGARLAGLALAAVWAFQLLAIPNGPFRPDWRSAAAFLEANAAPADNIIALQSLNYHALRYNSRLPASSLAYVDVWSEVGSAVEKAHRDRRNAWVALWLWNEPLNIEADLNRRRLPFTTIEFAGWPPLRLYSIPAPGLIACPPAEQEYAPPPGV